MHRVQETSSRQDVIIPFVLMRLNGVFAYQEAGRIVMVDEQLFYWFVQLAAGLLFQYILTVKRKTLDQ